MIRWKLRNRPSREPRSSETACYTLNSARNPPGQSRAPRVIKSYIYDADRVSAITHSPVWVGDQFTGCAEITTAGALLTVSLQGAVEAVAHCKDPLQRSNGCAHDPNMLPIIRRRNRWMPQIQVLVISCVNSVDSNACVLRFSSFAARFFTVAPEAAACFASLPVGGPGCVNLNPENWASLYVDEVEWWKAEMEAWEHWLSRSKR